MHPFQLSTEASLTYGLDLHVMRRRLLITMEGTQLSASLRSIKLYAGLISKKGQQKNDTASAALENEADFYLYAH